MTLCLSPSQFRGRQVSSDVIKITVKSRLSLKKVKRENMVSYVG